MNHTKSVMVLEPSKSRSKDKGYNRSNERPQSDMYRIKEQSNKTIQPQSNKSHKVVASYNQSLQVSPQYKSNLPLNSPFRG